MYKMEACSIENSIEFICENSSVYFTSILTGEAEGVIWADRRKEPKMLLIWSPYQEGFQFMGFPLEKKEWTQFRKWFDEEMIPFIKENNLNYFEYGTDRIEVAQMMKEIFHEYDIYEERQKILYLSKEKQIERPEAGYEFKKIEDSFLQKDYKNMDYITEEIEAAYGTASKYLEKGYGYAVLKNREVVARAIMTFSLQNKVNISVDTCLEYRRKGLSAYLTSLVVEEAKKRGQQPVWDCSEDNTASEKTAKKCGFQLVREDMVYGFGV